MIVKETIREEKKHHFTPRQLADAFAEADAREQVEFLNSVALSFRGWGDENCDAQLDYMADKMSDEAKRWLKDLLAFCEVSG